MTDQKAAASKPLKLTAPRVSEKSRQADGVALLRACGFTILELGQKRRPVMCRNCRTMNWPTFTDSSSGTPDTAVMFPGWGAPVALMFEWKADGTPVRPEQRALSEAGMTMIVRTAREVAEAVCAFERYVLNRDPNKRLIAWLDSDGAYTRPAEETAP